ncbi:MAG: T9SS type A sorting domain-containing protein, partial [candidate division Zixibacteria bacterium]|nr:T9SS type A sorting domain-containing protein [candidate division Zixibacteria bacterium]
CRGCQGDDWNEQAIATKLIKQAKFFPRHILNSKYPTTPTAFSDTMKWYIENHSLDRQNPLIPVANIDNSDQSVLSNYPNVFNANTRIDFNLPEAGHTKLEIYDLMGRKVEVLVDEYKVTGDYSVIWNAENYPSGIYFCKLTQGALKITKKMGLVK